MLSTFFSESASIILVCVVVEVNSALAFSSFLRSSSLALPYDVLICNIWRASANLRQLYKKVSINHTSDSFAANCSPCSSRKAVIAFSWAVALATISEPNTLHCSSDSFNCAQSAIGRL